MVGTPVDAVAARRLVVAPVIGGSVVVLSGGVGAAKHDGLLAASYEPFGEEVPPLDHCHANAPTGDAMRVSKQQVVEFIRERGDGDRADRAVSELPDHLDLPADEAKLLGYGVSPIDLAGDEPTTGEPRRAGKVARPRSRAAC